MQPDPDIHPDVLQPAARGIVSRIDGSVVEVTYPDGRLPAINTALVVLWDRAQKLVLEVQQHADPTRARCVAIHETAGLACGTGARDRGTAITVPVGDAVLGRMINVVGETIDKAMDRAEDLEANLDPKGKKKKKQ